MDKRLFKVVLVVLFALVLSSCSHVRRDGPPNFYVDETKVPNAVPKPEPFNPRNMRAYNVKGIRYYPMRSCRNYQAVGVASWYGTRFHEQRTSNGERYDMLGMTAAHKTLPLPTYVEVTNLNNHRKIIVKVNDRGPFKPGRLIDLSYVAAKKLGMLGRGTAPVRVKAIDPYEFARNLERARSRPPTYFSQSLLAANQNVKQRMQVQIRRRSIKNTTIVSTRKSPARFKQVANTQKKSTRRKYIARTKKKTVHFEYIARTKKKLPTKRIERIGSKASKPDRTYKI